MKLLNNRWYDDISKRDGLIIGNVVWIDQPVLVLPTCKKKWNRAVIGAGGIETKDMIPYNVVTRNSESFIRMWFLDEIIWKLESAEWWMWKKEALIRNSYLLKEIVCVKE